MHTRLISIAIHQTALTVAMVYAIFTLPFAVAFAFFPGFGYGKLSPWLAIFVPIGYFILGYVSCAVAAWIYNRAAAITGGIKFVLSSPPLAGASLGVKPAL